jgi:hypothetical protein
MIPLWKGKNPICFGVIRSKVKVTVTMNRISWQQDRFRTIPLNIQYTELKLSCGNDTVVKNTIYSNSHLDLWPNDPKINRILPLPQGNHVVKFGKDPIYRTSYHVETTLLSKIIFIVVVTLTFDPKINRVLPLLQGNHVAKFVKDPIYKTKVIVQKRPSCHKLYL